MNSTSVSKRINSIFNTKFYLKIFFSLTQIFKVYIRCSDIRKSWGKPKTVCAILRLKRPLYFNENEVKKSAPIICRQKFFLHFEIKFKIFRATGIRKMFRTKSSVLMSKWSITSQLSKMIGSNLYHILVILTFLFPAIFIKFGCTI